MNTILQPTIDALQQKDLIRATIEVNRAIQAQPDCAEAYALRGQISLAIGDKRGAAEDMKRAIELKPELLAQYTGEFQSK
ncbi:MAG: hypothetical protein IJV06_06620 [Bacteroidaceae bacterium]|nr:hypothetical protein [Bacteroidaceae bacterium]MBQ9641216.1 hypothetical protein [Bacteroidaceae bacterium]